MSIDIANLVVGLAGLIVGIAGIYFTVLSSPAALQALGSVFSHAGLPPQFRGLSGAITLFTLMLLMMVSYVFLCFGLVAVFTLLFQVFEAPAPRTFAVLSVLWLSAASANTTLYIYLSHDDATVTSVLSVAISVLITVLSLLYAFDNDIKHYKSTVENNLTLAAMWRINMLKDIRVTK